MLTLLRSDKNRQTSSTWDSTLSPTTCCRVLLKTRSFPKSSSLCLSGQYSKFLEGEFDWLSLCQMSMGTNQCLGNGWVHLRKWCLFSLWQRFSPGPNYLGSSEFFSQLSPNFWAFLFVPVLSDFSKKPPKLT